MIRVCQPTVSDEIREELWKVMDNGWLGCGPKTAQFEKEFADYVGKKYCVACNSGTSALDLCLKVYNMDGQLTGGELITTPLTFVSDAIIAEWHGMDLTFADIDRDSLCLDPDELVITEKTKAIVVVDSHGRLADIKKMREMFDGLIIEDAAHACYTPGVGKYSDITMWSFQAVKTLPAGDGGAITTDDEKIYKELQKLKWLNVEKTTWDRSKGKKYTWDYNITRGDGIKAYMNDIQATIALGQLHRLDELLAKRRAIQSVYNESFKNIPQIEIPQHSHTVQYYTIKAKDRDKLGEHLAEEDIATSVHFKPLTEMDYYKKGIKRLLPVTDNVWKELISLPCHDALKWSEVEYVIEKVKDFYA